MAAVGHAPVPKASATSTARHTLVTCNVLSGDHQREQQQKAVQEVLVRTGGMFHDSASLIGGRHQWYDSDSDWRRNDRGTVNVDEVLGAGEGYCAEMAYQHGPQSVARQLAFR